MAFSLSWVRETVTETETHTEREREREKRLCMCVIIIAFCKFLGERGGERNIHGDTEHVWMLMAFSLS